MHQRLQEPFHWLMRNLFRPQPQPQRKQRQRRLLLLLRPQHHQQRLRRRIARLHRIRWLWPGLQYKNQSSQEPHQLLNRNRFRPEARVQVIRNQSILLRTVAVLWLSFTVY